MIGAGSAPSQSTILNLSLSLYPSTPPQSDSRISIYLKASEELSVQVVVYPGEESADDDLDLRLGVVEVGSHAHHHLPSIQPLIVPGLRSRWKSCPRRSGRTDRTSPEESQLRGLWVRAHH